MAHFTYRAYQPDGSLAIGMIEASNTDAALDQLNTQQLVVFEVRENVRFDADVPWWARDIIHLGEGVPVKPLAGALRELSVLLEAGVSLEASLELAAGGVRHRPLRAFLGRALNDLRGGKTLSEALSDQPRLVPLRVLALLSAGEEANALPQTTARAATLLEDEIAFAGRIRGALAYPVILLIASILVVAGLMFFLAPNIAPIFIAADAEPPLMLRFMMATRDIILDQGIVVLAALMATIVGITTIQRSRSDLVERILLSVPGVGRLIVERDAARLAGTLSMMLRSGGTLLPALHATRNAVQTLYAKGLVDRAVEAIEEGRPLSAVIGASARMPEILKRTVEIGEAGNSLPDLLDNAARALDARVRAQLDTITTLATPLLTLVIGTIVGLIVLTTLTAILEINDVAIPAAN